MVSALMMHWHVMFSFKDYGHSLGFEILVRAQGIEATVEACLFYYPFINKVYIFSSPCVHPVVHGRTQLAPEHAHARVVGQVFPHVQCVHHAGGRTSGRHLTPHH